VAQVAVCSQVNTMWEERTVVEC